MPNISERDDRFEAARLANRSDAELWRWFCLMYEEGRIRWCKSGHGWLVSVDHKHLATESQFDAAIRNARQRFESGCRWSPKAKQTSGIASKELDRPVQVADRPTSNSDEKRLKQTSRFLAAR